MKDLLKAYEKDILISIMKNLMKTYEKDILKEQFTVLEALTFGIIVPGMFILSLVFWSMIQEWACR